MRSATRAPVAQNLWLAGLASCVIMMLGETAAGFVVLVAALLVAIALRVTQAR